MPVSRMRMRPWLEEQINSRRVEGLEWLDEEKTMFSIPWKHAARHGWQMEKDANLFQKWAVHTGKFKSGSTPDPKTWKANFRCAMNSLPDIEEVKNQSVNKGCGAVRVYRMLPEVHKKKDKRSKSRQERRKAKDMDASQVKAEESNMCEESTDRLPTGMDMTQENIVDSTIQRDIFDDEEIPYVPTEVITPDSTDRWTGTFQVSPQHSTDFEEEDAIRMITEQLEMGSPQWITSDINGRDYLSNEIGTTPDSSNSPQSQWSETSGEEFELQLVTELVSKSSPVMPQELIQMWPINTVY